MDLSYSYMKNRGDFGRQPLFCESGPEMCDSILPNPAEFKNYILRNPVSQVSQNTPSFSQREINTYRADYQTTGVNHAEGGWPKDVNILDIEATQRYRRKIEKDDAYIHCINATAPGMEHFVFQNNAIDIYRTYYEELPAMPHLERNSMRTVNVYRDPQKGRPVSSICWQPEGGHLFAVAYADVDINRNPQGSIDCYLWDVENANSPVSTIHTPSCLLDLQFNPRDSSVLAGGLMSGQVGVWDRRSGDRPIVISPSHVAHRDLVRNVIFINSKSAQEFFSGGPDGVCKWWDIRNMSEPTEEMIIDVVKYSFDVPSMANSYGISVLEYEPTIPTRFMVGCENGHIVSGNRKGKTPLDKLPAKFENAHVGPVFSLERNPFFLKNFLSVGDWRLQLWTEECKESPVLWSPPMQEKVTAATWSPTKCSLLMTTSFDGTVHAWDFLRRQHAPVLSMQVCDEPLLRVKMQELGSLAALGSGLGNIYMTELSQNLTQSDKNDKLLLNSIFERESKREKILEARLREIRLKQRQAEEGSPKRGSVGELDFSVGDRDLVEATQEYMSLVRKELAHL